MERYKQKLQASQALQKDNTDLREELEEVRGRFDAADEERKIVAGLQLRIKEYEKILPTLEQDRHELQLMKKELEFENIDLAQRWNAANEQHALDQENIADLSDKLEDTQRRISSSSVLRSNDNAGNLGGLGNLGSELEKRTEDEEQLQVASIALHWTRLLTMSRYKKIFELQAEIQQLKTDAANLGSKNTVLQQLLDQANEKLEEGEKRYLEIFQDKITLESSLESISQGDPIQRYTQHGAKVRNLIYNLDSTDVFRKTRDKVEAEQKRNSELQAELSMVKSQLQEANNSCKMLDTLYGKGLGHANSLSVSLGDERASQENTTSTEGLKASLKEVAGAAAANASGNTKSAGTKTPKKNIDAMAQMILKDREQLAKLAEVQKTKSFSKAFFDIELRELPTPPAPSSTIKRFSRFITKANHP